VIQNVTVEKMRFWAEWADFSGFSVQIDACQQELPIQSKPGPRGTTPLVDRNLISWRGRKWLIPMFF
jgi:hypothetical protein